ncbi:MAG: hypothetical protein Kow0025_23410 [Thermodesulfovibrionales bacterium]
MKSIRLWAREVERLSALERALFREALESLLSWEPFRKEYGELDLLARTLAMHNSADELSEIVGDGGSGGRHEVSKRYGIPF